MGGGEGFIGEEGNHTGENYGRLCGPSRRGVICPTASVSRCERALFTQRYLPNGFRVEVRARVRLPSRS